MQRGFSLFEIMLVLAVVGLMGGIAIPHLAGILDSIEADAAANHIVAAHQRARIMAVARGQVTVLTVDAGRLVIRLRGLESPLWSEAGPSAQRVALAPVSHQFTFSPEGITLGLSNATMRLTRGSALRSVVVSRLGRIRIQR
jgi:prepilin-type N-terminal cleavage/methylation domain-containing protein